MKLNRITPEFQVKLILEFEHYPIEIVIHNLNKIEVTVDTDGHWTFDSIKEMEAVFFKWA